MTTPRTPSLPSPAGSPRPLSGGDWWRARASLALRRSGRFARAWGLSVGALAALALLIPMASGDPNAADRSRLERGAADTLLSAQRVRSAEAVVTRAESVLVAALAEPPATQRSPAVASPPRLASPSIDPSVTAFDSLIQEARRLRTITSWLAVAAAPEVSSGPRMRALADSLAAYTRRRDALPSGPGRDKQLSELSQRIGRTGYTILAIAENRRADLVAAGALGAPPAVRPPARETVADPDAVTRPDTSALRAAVALAADTLSAVRRRHDSLGVALRSLEREFAASGYSPLAMISPAIILVGVLLTGLLVRFVAAMNREMNAPTLAHASESERVSGAPVLAIVRDALLDGPARYRASGVDPFRMLYLGLTATGTRARTAIITGSDPVIAAATGARLAIAAAADHRATLIVDLDPGQIALARTFRVRAEPGLTDVMAGGFKWREVARAVGSSDGLPITLLPAGTEREDLASGEALEPVRADFARFRGNFELTILVAPLAKLDLAVSLVESSPLILTAVIGETSVDRFSSESSTLRSTGRRLQGCVLWDAPKPELLSRAELAALLSKQKGRTPGGSFEAVKRAIDKYNK